MTTAPRVTAKMLTEAATRLLGSIVLDVADWIAQPAVYLPRLEAFATIDGDDLGADDGTLIVLVLPGVARDLIAEHGTAGRAAAAVNREIRAEWTA